ncbi:Pre-mRNA-splicing factor SPP2 [Colletotrichum sp. SAR 10_66]|nr:Pre-mRNA-splicing factor SPP2 [Colletotrichum sp. SAR 10_66]
MPHSHKVSFATTKDWRSLLHGVKREKPFSQLGYGGTTRIGHSRRLIAASPQGARRLNHGFDSDSDYESNNEWRHEVITDSGDKRKEKTPRELVIKS